MTSVRMPMPIASRLTEEVVDAAEDVFPERIVVDEATFAELSARIENPREPNAALRELFKK